jgi:hypothetical protein
MPVLPSSFTCTVNGPLNKLFQIDWYRSKSRSDVEKKIRSQMKKHCSAEMKIYFREHNMRKHETFKELEGIGFTVE